MRMREVGRLLLALVLASICTIFGLVVASMSWEGKYGRCLFPALITAVAYLCLRSMTNGSGPKV